MQCTHTIYVYVYIKLEQYICNVNIRLRNTRQICMISHQINN